MATSPMPKSRSHANLRQGLDRVSAESAVSVDPDRAMLAAAAATPSMRPSKSKLSMDTLATVESMNCPIIEYSQLEIKRKIGDGSIGQVSGQKAENFLHGGVGGGGGEDLGAGSCSSCRVGDGSIGQANGQLETLCRAGGGFQALAAGSCRPSSLRTAVLARPMVRAVSSADH